MPQRGQLCRTSPPKVGNATEASCSRTENSPTELLNRFHSPLLGVKILTPKTRKEIRHPKHTPIPGAYKHLPSLTANSGYLRSPSRESLASLSVRESWRTRTNCHVILAPAHCLTEPVLQSCLRSYQQHTGTQGTPARACLSLLGAAR